MGRPDFALLARQQRAIASFVGETAIYQYYVSAAAQNQLGEAVGLGASQYSATRVITGLFSPVTLPEIYAAGGQLITGDMNATLIDAIPGPSDAIVWRGVNYRVVSDPITQQILGRSAYRFVLRRGQNIGG